jgi:hypothetical protein
MEVFGLRDCSTLASRTLSNHTLCLRGMCTVPLVIAVTRAGVAETRMDMSAALRSVRRYRSIGELFLRELGLRLCQLDAVEDDLELTVRKVRPGG